MKNYEKRSFIMGILSIVTCWILVGFVFGIIGIVASVKGLKNGMKSKRLFAGLGLSVLSVVIVIALWVYAIKNPAPVEPDPQPAVSVEEELSAEEPEEEVPAEPELPESNSSAMVDYLASEAKKSANQSATEEKRDDAINFIYENYPDYYVDNETMEKAIYYGFYLEYAYGENEGKNYYVDLGMDTEQAVKYVYRGAESVEDSSTQENLSQIAESLNALGYQVEVPENDAQTSSESVTPAPQTESITPSTQAKTVQPSSDQPQEQMVWIPESGSKYHSNSSCSGMNNPTQVTISEAKAAGYTACKKCY